MTILVVALLAYATSWLLIAVIDARSRVATPVVRRTVDVPVTNPMRKAA